jgi:hypothetical protein
MGLLTQADEAVKKSLCEQKHFTPRRKDNKAKANCMSLRLGALASDCLFLLTFNGLG